MPASRAKQVKPAVRPAMPARLMLSGVAGSGKTWSALTIARILVGPEGRVVLIDTETDSALTYADEHTFEHLPWTPPFDPRDLAATIRDLSDGITTAIVVDSLTHFWEGDGGTLSIAHGRFTGWKEATPVQDDMVDAILRSRSHVIACVREKVHYDVSEGGGKQKVEKVGLAPKQRDGLDYEFNVAVSIDAAHEATVHKTRCRRLSGRVYRPNHIDEFATAYAEWLAGGQPVVSAEQAAELRALVGGLPGKEVESTLRADCMALFKERFGSPDQVLAEDLDAARELIEGFVAQVPKAEPGD